MFNEMWRKIQTVMVQLMRFLREMETLLRKEAKFCVFYSGRKWLPCAHVLRYGIKLNLEATDYIF